MNAAQTDRHFTMTLTVPCGTLAIGGYTAVPEELDVAHARDPDGRPIIPSTALRGALREALEAALRGAGRPACRGGDGVDPDTAGPDAAARACTLDGGGPCLTCRLFGTRGEGATGGGPEPFGALVLGDALGPAPDRPWSVTHGVTIERSRRSAREGQLFNREAPAAGAGLVFVAEGRLSDPAHKEALEVAAALTRHIGSNLSRGLGRVDIALAWRAGPAVGARCTADRDRRLVVTLTRPAHIGASLTDENTRLTRLDIPGSALRGAVGWAIAEQRTAAGDDPNTDAAFTALVAERPAGAGSGGAIFDFLYPCDGDPPDGLVGPWPATRRRCKDDPRHPTVDVLFDRLALGAAAPAEARRVVAGRHRRCPECGGPLEPARGWRGSRGAPTTRIVTRVALDRRRRSARDGALYSHQVIDLGARYVGSIRALPPGTGGRLAEGLAAPLSLGRGRSMGWGRVDITESDAPPPPPLDARRAAFTAALAARFADFGLGGRPVDRLVPLTLQSPLLLADEADDADVRLVEAAVGGRVVLQVRRFDIESGYDQRHGPRQRLRSVAAGAVYVIEVDGTWDATRAILEAIERDGIGDGRCRGYGRVICYDPAFTHHERGTMDDNGRGEQARQLVDAAEAVMRDAFADRQMRGRLSKSQMSQLIGVCNEAACHEEVVNYLRYQAGRSDPAWTIPMVDRVHETIAGIFEAQGIGRDDHTERMARWRRYATYLARAFTYHEAVERAKRRAP